MTDTAGMAQIGPPARSATANTLQKSFDLGVPNTFANLETARYALSSTKDRSGDSACARKVEEAGVVGRERRPFERLRAIPKPGTELRRRGCFRLNR